MKRSNLKIFKRISCLGLTSIMLTGAIAPGLTQNVFASAPTEMQSSVIVSDIEELQMFWATPISSDAQVEFWIGSIVMLNLFKSMVNNDLLDLEMDITVYVGNRTILNACNGLPGNIRVSLGG